MLFHLHETSAVHVMISATQDICDRRPGTPNSVWSAMHPLLSDGSQFPDRHVRKVTIKWMDVGSWSAFVELDHTTRPSSRSTPQLQTMTTMKLMSSMNNWTPSF